MKTIKKSKIYLSSYFLCMTLLTIIGVTHPSTTEPALLVSYLELLTGSIAHVNVFYLIIALSVIPWLIVLSAVIFAALWCINDARESNLSSLPKFAPAMVAWLPFIGMCVYFFRVHPVKLAITRSLYLSTIWLLFCAVFAFIYFVWF